jgi:hypothetical protein
VSRLRIHRRDDGCVPPSHGVGPDHLLGGCGDDVTAITTAMESCIEQRQELWRSGKTDEVPGLTVTIDLLWEALRYARLAEPPASTA